MFASICGNGWNMDSSLYSEIQTTVIWVDSNWWTSSKAPKSTTIGWKGYGLGILDVRGVIFIDYLEKGNTINSEYYISLLERLKTEIAKKRPHMAKKKMCFVKTTHRVTSQSIQWQNYMNWTSNHSHIHRIRQIWLAATTGCSQTWKKKCSPVRNFARMKKLSLKLRPILRQKINRSTKVVLKC